MDGLMAADFSISYGRIIMGDSRVGLLYFRSLGRALPLWNSDPEATKLLPLQSRYAYHNQLNQKEPKPWKVAGGAKPAGK